jgi:hypothetical protein
MFVSLVAELQYTNSLRNVVSLYRVEHGLAKSLSKQKKKQNITKNKTVKSLYVNYLHNVQLAI